LSAPRLRFDDVSLVRGGRLLFRNLDITLLPGEAVQVIGPNGSGKSSLLRLAANLLSPTTGRVQRSAVALSDEKLALDPELELRRALLFWSRLGGGAERLDGVLAGLGIDHLAQVPVGLLSTGQARRASLARVAASNARLWLLDEPANGLDGDGLARLSAMLRGHLRSGGAVVGASHVPLPGAWRSLELGP